MIKSKGYHQSAADRDKREQPQYRRDLFCKLVASGKSYTDAYIYAGFASDTEDRAVVRRRAYCMATKGFCRKRIAELKGELAGDVEKHRDMLLSRCNEVYDAAINGTARYGYNAQMGRFERTGEQLYDYSAAMKAVGLQAKMLGVETPDNGEKDGTIRVVIDAGLAGIVRQPEEIAGDG